MHSDGYQRNLFRRILNLVFKVPAEFIPADTSSIGDSPRTAGSRMQRARARRMAACAHGARTNAGNATAQKIPMAMQARHGRRQQNKQGELQALRAGPNGAYFESLRVMRTAYVWDV